RKRCFLLSTSTCPVYGRQGEPSFTGWLDQLRLPEGACGPFLSVCGRLQPPRFYSHIGRLLPAKRSLPQLCAAPDHSRFRPEVDFIQSVEQRWPKPPNHRIFFLPPLRSLSRLAAKPSSISLRLARTPQCLSRSKAMAL